METTTSGLAPALASGPSGRDARGPLFGREEERAVLAEARAAVLGRGEARAVTLVGPAGIGKSRLVKDLVAPPRGSAREDDAPALRVYRGTARDVAASFGIFARLLRSRFGLVEGMDPEAQKAQIRAQVAAVLEDRKVGDVVYFLGQFLSLPFDESPLTRAVKDDPHEASLLRRAVFRAFLEADAARSPLCLVFEDVHHAHDDSIALLRYLIEFLAGPILILCTARPELLRSSEDWELVGEERHQLLELGPLPDEAASALMRALLAPCASPEGPPEELVRRGVRFAGGTPLLLEQMVRICHDKGVLQSLEDDAFGDPRWRVDLGRLAEADLPLTVEDAIAARLAALSLSERQVLEHAAAMGSVFWSGCLVALGRVGREPPEIWDEDALAERERVDALLAGLVARDYLLELPDSTFPGSREYIFKHNEEREATRRRTSPAASRRCDQAIADWLEHQAGLFANEEQVAMLARHRAGAGEGERAGLAYLEAGDIARRRYASARAADYYQRGLALLGDGYAGRRIDALHNHGDVLFLLGKVDDALAAFREMLGLAYRLDLPAKGGAALARIGRLHRDTGSLEEAQAHLEAAGRLFERAGDERGVASTIDDLGRLFWMRGEYPAAEKALSEALARRRVLGDARSIALSLHNLGLVHQKAGALDAAAAAFEQALAVREEVGDLLGSVRTLHAMGQLAEDKRDFARAGELFERALERAAQVGDRSQTAVVLTSLGEASYRKGEVDRALELLAQAEALVGELGDKIGLGEALRALGKAHLLKGDLAKARECIGRAVDLFAAARSKARLGAALRTLGEITAAGGWGAAHKRSAREYFARALTIFEGAGSHVELARTLSAYARFLRSEPSFASDEAALAEAASMQARADALLERLRIPPLESVAPPPAELPGAAP